jgi:hypothetical protein
MLLTRWTFSVSAVVVGAAGPKRLVTGRIAASINKPMTREFRSGGGIDFAAKVGSARLVVVLAIEEAI